jgi:hypothetical protein
MSTPPAPTPRPASRRRLFLALGLGGGLALLVTIVAAVSVLGLIFGVVRGDARAAPSPGPSPSGTAPSDLDYGDLTFDSAYSLPSGSLASLTFRPPEGTDWVPDPDAADDADTMSYVSESTGCRLRLWQSTLDGVDVAAGDDEATSRNAASFIRDEAIGDDEFAMHTFTGGFAAAKVDFVDLLWGASNGNYLAVRAFGDAGIFVSLGVACAQSSAWDAVKMADSGLGVVILSE